MYDIKSHTLFTGKSLPILCIIELLLYYRIAVLFNYFVTTII